MKAPYYFVDNQKSGPFKYWHHQHFFKAQAEGVEMTDIVNYAISGGGLLRFIENTIVKKRVEEIFNYRHDKLREIFEEKG